MTDSEPTLSTPIGSLGPASTALLGLTILWHPDLDRIGQQFMGPGAEGVIELHRFSPLFRHPGQDGAALGHRCTARCPLMIRRDAEDGITLVAPDSRMTVEVNGVPITQAVYLPRADVGRGIVLGLGGMILVCVHWIWCLPKATRLPGLQGVSSAMVAVREQIQQVARTDLPVLLLGETGTGKDAAAWAIHCAGARKECAFVTINMAALSESLAAADLFGALKGAYTGAQSSRAGLFAEADRGTLFLDEIGDTPGPIQAMLLRVLETGEYRPLGAEHNRRSGARLITATDQNLGERGFNQALLRRLEAFVIRMPALRDRREDLGILLLHLLREWSAQSGHAVTLPTSFISEVCNDDWPGNIRQLAHVLRRASIAVSAGETPQLASFLRVAAEPHMVPAKADAPLRQRPQRQRARLADLSPQDILDAMESNDWQISGAAQQLGISRPSLYKLLDAHPAIRSAAQIPAAEIELALQRNRGNLKLCASSLKTPCEALRRHLRAIGLAG